MKQKLTLGENETEYESLSEDEVRTIVGETLDDRISKLEIPSLDADALKTDILDSVTNLFKEHETKPMDEDAFIKKMEKSFDSKLSNALKGIGGSGKKEREPGWLSRALLS